MSREYDFKVTEKQGVIIVEVMPDSPAAKAGLQKGDTVIKVGGSLVKTSVDVQEQVDASAIGATLPVEVIRKGKVRTIEVKPEAFPQQEFE